MADNDFNSPETERNSNWIDNRIWWEEKYDVLKNVSGATDGYHTDDTNRTSVNVNLDEETVNVNVVSQTETSETSADIDEAQLLSDILKEMKIMNLHLSYLTDMTIKKTDI